jgi:hypothetical protein
VDDDHKADRIDLQSGRPRGPATGRGGCGMRSGPASKRCVRGLTEPAIVVGPAGTEDGRFIAGLAESLLEFGSPAWRAPGEFADPPKWAV